MASFYDFLKSFGLDEIGDYNFVEALKNGSASSAIYKNDTNSVVVKFLICPRNKIELERFKLEYSVLKINQINSLYRNHVYELEQEAFHGPSDSYPLPKIKIEYEESGFGFISYFGYEYMEGVLLSEIDTTNMSTHEKCHLVYRVASALSYFNQTGYSHRDLHPNNILLLPSPQMARNDYELNNPKVKILDMGNCQKIVYQWSHVIPEIERNVDEKLVFDDNNRRLLSSFISMPPDFIEKGEDTKNYDSWAVGVYFYELLFGEKPYTPNGISDVTKLRVSKIYSSNFLTNLSKVDNSLKLIIENLLEPNGDSRPSTDAIVRLLWCYLYSEEFVGDSKYAEHIILNGGIDPDDRDEHFG
ncbi:protein kinase domain-containing protein [Yersinia intermedia]|uniref:protein kinase domain-containing protein n=1 Tax=Yersinia intermedia TaxID=631 RepID=UPI00065CCF38|nr:protein kinase [Yersinia intermedia]CRY84153.1 Serine/threonine-protein kinase PrkC [Yersinia intermedia]